MTALKIDLVASDEGPLLLRVSGDLEYPNIATFRAALKRAMAPGRPIVINVQGLEFLDSTGLGALLEAKHVADIRGTDIRVEGHQARGRAAAPPHRHALGAHGAVEQDPPARRRPRRRKPPGR